MATRSTIALEFADGSVSQVYCHWDGYLSGVGAQLEEYYTDPFLLQELIDGGDMSSIGEHYTLRGESIEDTCARRFQTVDEYFADCQQEEYDYILRPVDGKGVWFVRCYATDGEWVELSKAFELELLPSNRNRSLCLDLGREVTMALETGITLTVYADVDYRYEVNVADEIDLTYKEDGRDRDLRIGFGSLDEMEAVARAMLNAVKLARDSG